jgi:predicted lipid-binding transport protein (Tim44 family)
VAKSTQIQSRISAIAKDLANGKERAELLRKYAKKWQIAERTIDRYITDAKNEAQTLRNLAKETANDTLVEEVKEAVRNGLKTKTERLMILQDEVSDCKEELISGKNNGAKLTVFEKVALRKTIKELQSEISKIEGDYATEKIDVTTKGNSVNTSQLPTDLKKQILAQLRNHK